VRRFPEMVPDHPDAAGAAVSRSAREWLKTEWSGETFLVGTNARGWNSVLTLLFTPDNRQRTTNFSIHALM